MDYKDNIRRFQAYALTHSSSLYNEESKTAQGLMIQCTRKIQECMNILKVYGEAIENIKTYLKMNYEEESEQLVLTLAQQLETLKVQIDSSYVDIYNEEAMDVGELAGRTACAVNECLKACNMLGDILMGINDNVVTYDIAQETLVIGGQEHEQ